MKLLWYATRATGEVSFLLLTAVLVLGVLSAIRIGGERVPRFVVTGLHRNLSLVSLVFLAGHILTAILDPFAGIGVTDAVLPFGSAYRRAWVGLGAIAFDLLAALIVTSLLRERIGQRAWKVLHWATYGCWLIALVHALGTGTDVRTTLGVPLAGIGTGAGLVMIGWRLSRIPPQHARTRTVITGIGVLTAIVILTWALTGPFAPGWARRAGTPAKILNGNHAAGADVR